MALFKFIFSGTVKKCDHKMAGDKPLIEMSLCKKEKGRNGEEDSYTWIRATLWQPAEFQSQRIKVGAFVSGVGDFKLRSYMKDGVKGVSAEVRCSSFDVEVSDGEQQASAPDRPAPAPARPVARNDDPEGPPF